METLDNKEVRPDKNKYLSIHKMVRNLTNKHKTNGTASNIT